MDNPRITRRRFLGDDPDAEQFLNDNANRMLARTMRTPWRL